MTAYPPRFEKVYVISDIHMGGRWVGDDNFQVFNQGARLGRFILDITKEDADGDLALIINGDTFDSLAEDIGSYVALDDSVALGMMERLYADKAFAPVWDALATFIRTPRRHLVFIIGNHDIELALPVVEHSIREQLTDGDAAASARITFSALGGGYTCRVGRSRVFCTHGNELDEWNWVDYSALGQLANAMNGGRRVDASRWKPNAGTRLVIDVMNTIKRQLPFVDLLKPESAAVAGVLMTLDFEQMKRIDFPSALPVLRDRRAGRRLTSQILGAYAAEMHAPDTQPAIGGLPSELFGPNLRGIADAGGSASIEDELLLEAERARGTARLVRASDTVQTLGLTDLVGGLIGILSKPEALRRALLDWLAGDLTFATSDPKDSLYLGMADRVTSAIDFVVTGHTHQARAMTFDWGGHYFNSGTWIRLMQLTKESLAPETFEKDVWPVLRAGRMSTLDGAMIPGRDNRKQPLVLDRTTAVRIAIEDDRVRGELLRISGDDQGIVVDREDGTTALEARRS
jgi:UDP-2,3-diacylglucosamine pyrophosphatase LpxH